jgi:hypothetical protein
MKSKFLLLFLLFCIDYASGIGIDGKWLSSTDNSIYIYDDEGNIRIQIVLDKEDTYTWVGKWVSKGESFTFNNGNDTFNGTLEHDNLIILTGEKTKDTFVWRRVKKILPKTEEKKIVPIPVVQKKEKKEEKKEAPKKVIKKPGKDKNIIPLPYEKEYHASETIVEWTFHLSRKGQTFVSRAGDNTSIIYTWKDDEGLWLSVVVPIVSVNYPNWGVALHFLRDKTEWVLKDMRPMKLTEIRSGNYIWQDDATNCIPIKKSDTWKLDIGPRNSFFFEYNGNLNVNQNKWINYIKIKGVSKLLTN